MPIEIRELHIRAVVNNQDGQNPQKGTENNNPATAETPDQNQLVAKCVEKVMEILEQKKEF